MCAHEQMANYWEPAKKLLNDPTKFLESLLTYDKDNISDGVIKRVEPYIQASQNKLAMPLSCPFPPQVEQGPTAHRFPTAHGIFKS